jgi:hypothetical protein
VTGLSLTSALSSTTGLWSGVIGLWSGASGLVDGSGGGGFSPALLFASGEQGVWYDPSDFSTMYQDNLGVTPVTAVGQSVGRIEDKSGRGNHATQSNVSQRPILGRVPFGGRRNLLLATDTLATQSRTVTAVAHTLSFTGTGTVTLSGASTAGPLVGTGAGNRVSLTFTPTAGSLTLTVSGSVTFAQLETGSTATAYQKVVTEFDVTEAGVADCYYLQFDGSDDGMLTGTITPGIDKAQVFAGVRKLSDVNEQSILETGSSWAVGSGTLILAVNTATFEIFSASRGSVGANINLGARTSEAIFAAPVTAVLASEHDISGDLSTLRLNGQSKTNSVVDKGTGNFSANPLYLGRRGGTTLPFNGQLYGLIVRFGANLTAPTITQTENYMAGETGITI